MRSCVLLSVVSLYVGVAAIAGTQSVADDEVLVYQDKTVRMIVPECPLAPGSVKVVPNEDLTVFSEWSNSNKQETYELLQRIVRQWEKKGITDYLIYGKESANSETPFGWEIVPYPKKGSRFWKQFKVLWNITYNGKCLPKVERQKIAKDYQNEKDLFSEAQCEVIASIQEVVREHDAFCDQKVIDSQLVFEGKEVYVLYNYAPIVLGKDKLHFLIVPKQHRLRFSDLSESEYLESMEFSQKLVSYYQKKGYHTAYLFNKTGAEAGQTVPHWHEHVVFTATKAQEFFGRLKMLKNMIFGSSPLPAEELHRRVEMLRDELADTLNDR